MKKTLIWDLPTRVLHWSFAASLTASLGIALVVDDDSPLFQLHMLCGLVAVLLVVVRVVLGLAGSRHARFANFPLRPVEAVRYLLGAFTGGAKTYAGNNPGSALAALAMFALVPLLVLTGIGSGGEAYEDVHGVLAYILLGVIGAHLLGLVLHTIRHRDHVAVAMITGRKDSPAGDGIASAHPVWGGVIFAAAMAWVIALFTGHDAKAATVRVPLIGVVVQLGENEAGERHGGGHEHREHRDRDDDHD
jgi:cytochrome b